MIRKAKCEECQTHWEYESQRRTRIPALCPNCRVLPDVLRRKADAQRAARRKAGEDRAAALDELLKRRRTNDND